MRVRALCSFADPAGSYARGQLLELPAGVDWLAAGLVEPVEQAIEQAIEAGPVNDTNHTPIAAQRAAGEPTGPLKRQRKR